MKRKGLLLIAAVYVFLAVGYVIAIAVDTGIIPNPWTITLNHALKAFLTIPLWLLFFRRLDGLSLWKKGIIHLITLPLFAWIWVQSYYALCDFFDLFYLKGNRQIWDYYLTGLFYTIQFGIFHIFDYYSKMQSKDLLIAQQNQLRLQSELTALKAQLNPHFLYNVFNTINASVPSGAEKTRNMIAKLSDLFRYQLKASKKELVSVKEEIDFVTKYLDLEKERFGERLNYHIDIEKEIYSCSIPPLIIQPIVENAVKHGISPLISGGEISISIKKKNNLLLVSIRDTGVGLDEQSNDKLLNNGVGLSNTHERLKRMYGNGIELTANNPNGLIVDFSLNLSKEYA